MATQTVRVQVALPAGTYHVNVQVGNQTVDTYTNLALAATANPSCWTFQVSAATAGLYSFNIFDDADVLIAFGWFYSDVDVTKTIQDSNTADGALAASRIAKLPQVGKTLRYTKALAGTLAVDVTITDPA